MNVPLFQNADFVSIGPPNSALVSGCKMAAENHNLPYTMYDRKTFLDKYPQFHMKENEVAFIDHAAGLVYPEQCVKTYLAHAEKHGAKILENTRVISWEELPDRVRVYLEGGMIVEATQIVITAGAYTNHLVKNLGVKLRVNRRIQAWIEPEKDQEACRFDKRLPLGYFFHNDGQVIYGHATIPGVGPAGIKFGDFNSVHNPTELLDADKVTEFTPEEVEAFRKETETLIPASKGKVIHHRKCFFTNTPDGHFILDRLPNHKRVVVGCGFSGHGFKFMPTMGQVLADLTIDGKTKWDVDFLSLKRFQRAKL